MCSTKLSSNSIYYAYPEFLKNKESFFFFSAKIKRLSGANNLLDISIPLNIWLVFNSTYS
jgi:hypothetical protein